MCAATGARLIHISTDCVFSGRKGNYLETDFPDAEDLYGRSKLLGEVTQQSHALTLRTSIIGFELATRFGLIEWFLSNRGKEVNGYRRAIFSGLTTMELSRLIIELITQHPTLAGLYQVSVDPIDKYTLLCMVNDVFQTGITIKPVDNVEINRSLDSTRFRKAVGWITPAWNDMIKAMFEHYIAR